MPTNSKIGIFSQYPVSELKDFIERNYNIRCRRLSLNKTAMDNTVLEADDKWIIKIYESKQAEEIKKSYRQYQSCRLFFAITPALTQDKSFYTLFHNHVMILYPKAMGVFNQYPTGAVRLLAEFHKAGQKEVKLCPVKKFISQIENKIGTYLSPYVVQRLKMRNRYSVYEQLLNRLSKLDYPEKCPFPYGKIHGDSSPSNIIQTPESSLFIDIDTLGTGYQVYDLVDYFLKRSEKYSKPVEEKLLKQYFTQSGLNLDFDNFYRTFLFLSCYQGIKIALSTEYWCFEKHKFSEDDLNKHYLGRVMQLVTSIDQRVSYLEGREKCRTKNSFLSPERLAQEKALCYTR